LKLVLLTVQKTYLNNQKKLVIRNKIKKLVWAVSKQNSNCKGKKCDFNGMEGKEMKDVYMKLLGMVIVVMILVFSISIFLTQKEIENINNDIEDVYDQPLSVRILSDTNSGTNPLTVNFKPLVLNRRNKLDFYWEFGDENTSKEEKPAHIFKNIGTFCCKLTIKDGDMEAYDSFNITILPNNPPDVEIKVDKTTGFRPEEVFFDAQVTDPEGDELTYVWKIKYPPFFSKEREDTITEKNFTKKFRRFGNYVAELTVTDEAGNSVTQFVRIQILKSEFESNIGSISDLITSFKTLIWPILEGNLGPILYNFLDRYWLNLNPFIQKLIAALLDFLDINYDPIIPFTNLEISGIENINHSLTVSELGGVITETSMGSEIIIKNNDKDNTAKNIYLTLSNPLSDKKGLPEEIELEELEISINTNGFSKKLFFNGSYKNFRNGYFIERLDYGDEFIGNIVVTLKNAPDGTFIDEESYPCSLFIYQEKADYVDEVSFTIIT